MEVSPIGSNREDTGVEGLLILVVRVADSMVPPATQKDQPCPVRIAQQVIEPMPFRREVPIGIRNRSSLGDGEDQF